MKAVQESERTWRFPRLQLEDQLWLALFVWAGAAVFAMVVVTVVSFFRGIEISAWEIASGVAPWFVGIMSGWIMYTQVPLFVANGRTRRDSYIEWLIVAAIYPAWTAFLTVIGYLIEKGVYGIAGWSDELSEEHLFSSHTDVGVIFLEYFLQFTVWVAVGAFIGASLYRSEDLGWLSLIPGTLLIVVSGSMERGGIFLFGIVQRLIPEFDPGSLAIAIPFALSGAAIAMVCTWFVVRDMPLRNR